MHRAPVHHTCTSSLGEKLYNECSFLVVDRPGYTLPQGLPSNFTLLKPIQGTTIVTEEISSSEIRKRIKSPNFGDTERSELEQVRSTRGCA